MMSSLGLVMWVRVQGLHDYCGSDEHGWAFNQIGKPLHNVLGGSEQPHVGRVAHLRAGDEVTVCLCVCMCVCEGT